MSRNVLRIGHRGACGYAPENTLSSFRKALELNVDMVEFDVHRCGSGEIVVIHDENLERTTDGKGPVSEKSYEEIACLHAGGGEKIPLLEEVLDLLDARSAVNIELKGEGTAGPVLEIVKKYLSERAWSTDDFLLSSFSLGELIASRELSPIIRIGLLVSSGEVPSFDAARELSAYSIHFPLDSVSEEMVQESHRRGLKVFVWTVNERAEVKTVKALGVDGIFSNYPDIV